MNLKENSEIGEKLVSMGGRRKQKQLREIIALQKTEKLQWDRLVFSVKVSLLIIPNREVFFANRQYFQMQKDFTGHIWDKQTYLWQPREELVQLLIENEACRR